MSASEGCRSPITFLQPLATVSSLLKRAPDGNGVRLWKNHVDRIQDPVEGLTLTRRILARGLLLPLHPILFLSLSSILSLLLTLSIPPSVSPLLEHWYWQNFKLFIYLSTHYDSPSHLSPSKDFRQEGIRKTALIWTLLCPQVLRNCLTGLLPELHNPLYIQLEEGEWFTLRIFFPCLLHFWRNWVLEWPLLKAQRHKPCWNIIQLIWHFFQIRRIIIRNVDDVCRGWVCWDLHRQVVILISSIKFVFVFLREHGQAPKLGARLDYFEKTTRVKIYWFQDESSTMFTNLHTVKQVRE